MAVTYRTALADLVRTPTPAADGTDFPSLAGLWAAASVTGTGHLDATDPAGSCSGCRDDLVLDLFRQSVYEMAMGAMGAKIMALPGPVADVVLPVLRRIVRCTDELADELFAGERYPDTDDVVTAGYLLM